ncbi:hypothetical protein JZU68_01015, partial [bacterium]|nr:hypothetical protein [bacterium]
EIASCEALSSNACEVFLSFMRLKIILSVYNQPPNPRRGNREMFVKFLSQLNLEILVMALLFIFPKYIKQ